MSNINYASMAHCVRRDLSAWCHAQCYILQHLCITCCVTAEVVPSSKRDNYRLLGLVYSGISDCHMEVLASEEREKAEVLSFERAE